MGSPWDLSADDQQVVEEKEVYFLEELLGPQGAGGLGARHLLQLPLLQQPARMRDDGHGLWGAAVAAEQPGLLPPGHSLEWGSILGNLERGLSCSLLPMGHSTAGKLDKGKWQVYICVSVPVFPVVCASVSHMEAGMHGVGVQLCVCVISLLDAGSGSQQRGRGPQGPGREAGPILASI